jgi:23S rRNA pseudouridine2605 synthase
MHSEGKSRSSLPPRHGVARVLSKLGLASRTLAAQWVRDGCVTVNGEVVRDPEFPVRTGLDKVEVTGRSAVADGNVSAASFRCLMLNKPRGLVTSTRDEQGRDTVYRCFDGANLPWLAPVGRLDKASEGLLLFCNDPAWAARLTDPVTGPDKTYHVQIDCIPDDAALALLRPGAKSVQLLRVGEKNAWLEIVLDEGRNRQIRRLLAAFDISVLRLIRVAIGPVQLGQLAKGHWRDLSDEEIASLST